MGSCDNSLEVEVVREPLHPSAVEQLQHQQQQQQQNMCLIKVLDSEQEQLPSLENGFRPSNGNVGPASVLDGCLEFSRNDNGGGEGSSVVDKGIGLAYNNGNAASLVPAKFSEDEGGVIGSNLSQSQSGIDDCVEEADALFAEKPGLKHCEPSLLEGASVNKGIGSVCENGDVVSLVLEKLSNDEFKIVGSNLNEKQSETDDCSAETEELKLESSNEHCGLVNSLGNCDQSLELMAVSSLFENHDEQARQKDDGSGSIQADIEEKSDGLAAADTDTCDQMGPSLNCEMSAASRPVYTFARNEVEQDKQQGSGASLERVLVGMENQTVSLSGTETDDNRKILSSPGHKSKPQLMLTTDPLAGVQQDNKIVNSPVEGVMNEKSNSSPGTEATIYSQLVSHQGFDKSLELLPLICSPEKCVQQDEEIDRPAILYSDGIKENESDLLATEQAFVGNEILSSLADKMCMESDPCSGLPGNCCQQNDMKTKPESSVPLWRAVDGMNDALATLDSDACTQKSSYRTETLEEISITGLVDILSNCDQKNEQRDDMSVNSPLVDSKPDVQEGSDLTMETKVEIHGQELSTEGDAYDLKECSPKIDLTTSPVSYQSFGVTGNSSSTELDATHHIGKADFSAIYYSECSEQKNNGGKDLATDDCPSKTGCPGIGSSSSQRSSRTRKSSQKPQTKRAARKSRRKDKALDLQIFKAERRQRSCLSKPARSSNWGLLGNIAQFFELSNGLLLNEVQNHGPSQKKIGRGGRKLNRSRAGGSSQRSSVKSRTSTSGIRLKVRVGNEIVQNGLNIKVTEVIDTSSSAGVFVGDFETNSYQGASFEVPNFPACGEVKLDEVGTEEQLECFGNKLNEARIHSDALVSDFHVSNKDSDNIVISQKSSEDAEADYLGIPSRAEVDALDTAIEKRYTDPGTSPDSEVINVVPEGQVNARCQEDFPNAVLTSSEAFVLPRAVPISKKEKKKGRVTHPSNFFPDDKSPIVASLNKVKATKNRRGMQRKGDEYFSSKMLSSSTSAYTSSNSLSSKDFSDEHLPLSRETEFTVCREALPEELGTETKISSGLEIDLSLSEPHNSSKLLSSTKSKGCQRPRKSGGSSKGRSKVSDKVRSKRGDSHRQRRNEQKLINKNKVKEKIECNDFIYKEEADPEIDDIKKPNHHDITADMAVANSDMAPSDAAEQHLPVDNAAWVRCDACYKWRRIPVALVDSIGQTNCQWICKDNMDKDFADCSILQEKSNEEINAELGLSDADEDVCDVPSKNKALEYKCVAVSKEHEFTRISTNQFLHRSRKTQTIDEIMVCNCKLPRDGGLGCGDACLNRMLNIECVRGTCSCGDLCSNQQFQKRNYANMKWDRCGKKGFGLRLEEDISKGQFLIEYVGEVLDMHTYEERQREYAFKGHKHFYFMTLSGSEVIDACAKGNLGRFINHSCDPNCRTEKWVVNGEICIGLFALRDIKKGEEVTFDYNYVRVCGAAAKKCYCASPQCRGYIGGPTNAEVIDQVDSDEEFLEPVMLEVEETGDKMKNTASRTSSFDNVELQAAESVSNDRDKMDNSKIAAGKMEIATRIGDSVNPYTSAISQSHRKLEMDDLKECFSSSSQQADDATIEFSPDVKQEISIEEIQRLETSSATTLSKSSSDDMVAYRKPKSAAVEEKRVFVKSRFLIKTSHESGAKKGKFTGNPLNVNKVQTMANKSQVLSVKPKKLMDGTTNGRFEAVEGKLNELLDTDGGISKRKDAAKGYLKFLLLTAAGASGNGEAIQSNRDLSMILDALLKTKSRVVLIDIINKNGLRMLHNMLKQYRSDFKKTPILRKLLKVLEYLAAREILTPEHIYGGPPCPGMESFRKSMLSLTEHSDKQVHQIARSFRDRWFPRHGRKYSYMDRDDGRMDFHRGLVCNRPSASDKHFRDLTGRPIELIDGGMQPKVATALVDSAVHEGCSQPCVGGGTKTRKRKSRWDQPAEEKPSPMSQQHDEQRIQSGLLQQSRHSPPPDIGKGMPDNVDKGSRENSCCPHCVRNYHRLVEGNCADIGRQHIQSDVPPGFSSALDPSLVSPNASSTIPDLPQQNGCLIPFGTVIGNPQRKFISRLSVSYGIPLSIVQQFGLPQDGNVESWAIAPGMPFHPFPPLPPFPHHRNETSSSCAVNSMVIDETTEGQQSRQDPATCYPTEKNPSTTGATQSDMDVPGENSYQTFKRARASSQDLGRRYFRQQKWNKVPPWIRKMDGWGHLGNNPKGSICSPDVGSVTNEPKSSYFSQDVSCRVEKAGNYINQQNSS